MFFSAGCKVRILLLPFLCIFGNITYAKTSTYIFLCVAGLLVESRWSNTLLTHFAGRMNDICNCVERLEYRCILSGIRFPSGWLMEAFGVHYAVNKNSPLQSTHYCPGLSLGGLSLEANIPVKKLFRRRLL